MRTTRRPLRRMGRTITVVAAAAAASLVLGIGSGIAPAVADPNYPTWAEVHAAQHNVHAKRAEIEKLNKLIASLQNQAAAAGKTAAIAEEKYLDAQQALDKATATEASLTKQSEAAATKAKASEAQAGELAAQLAREGDGSLTLAIFLSGDHSDNLLDALGSMSKLSQTSSQIFAQAETDHKTADALRAEAVVAKKARVGLAAKAQTTLAAAKTAAAASIARVSAANKTQNTMTAQLASLKGVSNAVIKQYYAGVAWEAKQAAKTTPPPDGAPIGSTPSAPSGSLVAGAIQFAEAQLGKPYVLDGAGPNVWDCSGLTMQAYASVGVYIGTHSATDQYNTLRAEGKLVPLSEREPGDLLWYSDGGSTSAIKYHVTLYIGNGEMIEAPYPGVGVRIAAVRFGDLVPYAGRPTE